MSLKGCWVEGGALHLGGPIWKFSQEIFFIKVTALLSTASKSAVLVHSVHACYICSPFRTLFDFSIGTSLKSLLILRIESELKCFGVNNNAGSIYFCVFIAFFLVLLFTIV